MPTPRKRSTGRLLAALVLLGALLAPVASASLPPPASVAELLAELTSPAGPSPSSASLAASAPRYPPAGVAAALEHNLVPPPEEQLDTARASKAARSAATAAALSCLWKLRRIPPVA